jgi:hypothetical protein
MMETYLGDAVYARYDEVTGHIVLTTEDVIQTTNIIYLEPDVADNVVKYIKMVEMERNTRVSD